MAGVAAWVGELLAATGSQSPNGQLDNLATSALAGGMLGADDIASLRQSDPNIDPAVIEVMKKTPAS